MKHNTELKVSKPLFDNDLVNITEEYFFRKLAVDTINGIPFDELSKLFKFKKIVFQKKVKSNISSLLKLLLNNSRD